MPNQNFQGRQALTEVGLGVHVARPTSAMTTGLPLFHVYGGRVLVNLILGQVTTIMEAKASASQLQADPTTGTTNALCGTVEMNAAEAGTLIAITGTVGDAMVLGKSGAVGTQASPVAVAVGDIEYVMADTQTGSIKWDLWYVPLDTGAYVAAV